MLFRAMLIRPILANKRAAHALLTCSAVVTSAMGWCHAAPAGCTPRLPF